jgi:Cell cycle protein
MTYRTREFLNLTVVGLLTGIGFTSVYVARQDVVSTGSLSYALIFFGLYFAAHLVARVSVPYADPYLLPMAMLLTGIGVTEIYRLNPDDAFRQGLWVVIAVILFAVTLLLLRHDYRRLESYKYLFGLCALGLLALPALPIVGHTVNGARLWVDLGPLSFQPGEFAKIMLIVFLAAYLRDKREVLAQGRPKDFGPLLAIWGGAMLVLFQTNDLGSGLLYFGIFLAMLYVATGKSWFVLAGSSWWARPPSIPSSRTFATASRPGSTPGRMPRETASRSSSPCTRSATARSAGRASARARSRPRTGRR